MKQGIKIAIAIIFILSLGSPVFARSRGLVEFFNAPPEPRLMYPTGETVILTGKDFLEFKWWISGFIDIDYYDFRLYKGYNMYASNLIFKQRLPANTFSIKIESSLFEDGQVYTWALRQIVYSGEKSDPSFDSFKIIKK